MADTKFSLLLERACLPTSSELVSFRMPRTVGRKLLSRSSEVKNLCLSPSNIGKYLDAEAPFFRYRAGLKEVQILNKLKQADPDDKKHIVRLERTFEHRGHLCLVFESMRLVLLQCSIFRCA